MENSQKGNNNKELANINMGINSEVPKDILEKDHVKEIVYSCLELQPCRGNDIDLTNINRVINSEVAKDILEKDHVKKKVSSSDSTLKQGNNKQKGIITNKRDNTKGNTIS